jgi:hypothetical protein
MKTSSSSSHSTAPNKDPAAPQASPTGAPAAQAAPASNAQKRTFNVPRDPNNKVSAAKVGATPATGQPANQPAGGAPGSPAAAIQAQATADANARAAKLGSVVGAPAGGATQDTVASSTSSKTVKASDPAGGVKPTPAPTRKGPSPGSRPPLRAKPVETAKLGAEDLLQRLRYFENLNEVQVKYIKALQGLVSRTGTAVPTMPHIAPFLSPAGNVDPNVQVTYP